MPPEEKGTPTVRGANRGSCDWRARADGGNGAPFEETLPEGIGASEGFGSRAQETCVAGKVALPTVRLGAVRRPRIRLSVRDELAQNPVVARLVANPSSNNSWVDIQSVDARSTALLLGELPPVIDPTRAVPVDV